MTCTTIEYPQCLMPGTGIVDCPVCARYIARGSPLPCIDHEDDCDADGWSCEDTT